MVRGTAWMDCAMTRGSWSSSSPRVPRSQCFLEALGLRLGPSQEAGGAGEGHAGGRGGWTALGASDAHGRGVSSFQKVSAEVKARPPW